MAKSSTPGQSQCHNLSRLSPLLSVLRRWRRQSQCTHPRLEGRCTATPTASNSSLESEITSQVRLECRDREGGKITYSVDRQTQKLGTYILTIDGEHEEEVCEIALVESSNSVCSEINKDAFLRRSARISLTTNNGITSPVRAANPLGFMRMTPLPLCRKSSENSE